MNKKLSLPREKVGRIDSQSGVAYTFNVAEAMDFVFLNAGKRTIPIIFVRGTNCLACVIVSRFNWQCMNAKQLGNKIMKMLLALVLGLTIAGCSSTPKKECEECYRHSDCEGALNCHSRPMTDGSFRDVCVDTSKTITCPVAQPAATK